MAAERRKSKCRGLSDLRQFPLYVGLVQIVTGLIPAFDVQGSQFHAILSYNGLGREFGWVMVLTGVYLSAGAIFARRETLNIGMFFAAVIWSCVAFMMGEVWWGELWYEADTQRWFTPGTLTMPITAVLCWFSLFREMIVRPVEIQERRKGCDSFCNG